MKTSLIGTLFLALLCIGAQPDSEKATWRPAPRNVAEIAADPDWLIVPKTDFYEVVPSQIGSSLVRDIPEKGFKQLGESQAKALTGHYYACPPGKIPFLVRAVYAEDAGIGRLRVERKGNSVAVIWGTLGLLSSNAKLHESALVVNLDFTPHEIYFDSSSIPSMP